MKILAITVLALTVIGGAATANASPNVDDCHSLSDSVYGVWGCR